MEFNANLALDKIKIYFNNYKEFVKNNPLIASEIESTLRWISYLITATKLNNSHIISELLYSCSSLLALFNDTILRKAIDIKINVNLVVERLQVLLTIIEYIQVFAEFTATRVYGEFGQWLVLTVIQLSKAIIRLILLLKYKQGLQRAQIIVPLDRIKYKQVKAEGSSSQTGANYGNGDASGARDAEQELEDTTFTLKRSGRVLRTIEKAPPRTQRTWLSPIDNYQMKQILEKRRPNAPPSHLDDHQLIGEVLHIIKPMAHLTALAGFGRQSWTPYLVALGLDVASLKLLSDPPNKHWTISERVELGQRSFALLAYLLRSPFYDKYTKQKILAILRFLSEHIPLFGRLIRPLIDYLPEWQKTYFYVWNI